MMEPENESAMNTDSEPEDESLIEIDYKIHKLDDDNVDEIEYLTTKMKIIDDKKLLDVKDSVILITADEIVLAVFVVLGLSEAKKIMHSTLIKVINKFELDPERTSVIISERVMNLPVKEIYRMYDQVLTNRSHVIFVSRFKHVSGKDLNDLIEDFSEIKPKELKKLPCNIEELFLLDLCEKCEVVDVRGAHYRIMNIKEEKIKCFLTKLSKEID